MQQERKYGEQLVRGRIHKTVRVIDLLPGDKDQNGSEYQIIKKTPKQITFKNSVGTYTMRNDSQVLLYAGEVKVSGADLEARDAYAELKRREKW